MPQARHTDPTASQDNAFSTRSLEVIEALDPASRKKVIDFIARLKQPQELADIGRGQSDWDLPSQPDVYVQHREQWL